MSHDHAAAGDHKPHVLPIRVYAGVWIGLLILTIITVKVSYYDFGVLNLVIAMLVATAKASLVVLFFMHLKYDEPFNKLVFMGSLAFLAVFFILTLADTMERGKVDPLEAREIVPVPARPELSEGGAGHGGEGSVPAAGETPAGETHAGEVDPAHPGDAAPAHEADGSGTETPATPPGDAGGH
jgi:cytochrome c oxidase subunit 4